ncbi:hypothetical protein [Streptomyces sp. 4R-3d]|uniref:hypothetical protein n=1 Tax=Streptomyces sp. 4R-3d TaxID=2559605 RepID=UPI001072A264|nr:hypothetical protein [Streptomyces sp. 4R-3d]TFI24507.1 hypothetical protein E4P36_22790 [Streptomyces sp. 4R-3d]
MLTYEDIINAPVAKLKAAADGWTKMTARLDRLVPDAWDGMKGRADKASWQGVNAGVTKEFIAKTAQEFKDAAAEARGVMQILEDGYAAIKTARDQLLNIRDDEGPAANIHVDAKGKVTARDSVKDIPAQIRANDPDYPAILQQENKNVAAWQAKIDSIVENCGDTDVAFKNALEANVTDRKDFSGPTYTTLDQEEAARAAALAGKGRDLTHTELQALNELLKDNSKSVEFSRNFYEKLGPEKSLAFFGQLGTDTSTYGKVDSERLKDVQELQRNLGLNLATASHDPKFTAEWGPELRQLGTERVPLYKGDPNGAYGYQLLGGIMRSGNYDPKFLNPMAEHVAQLHQKNPYQFSAFGMGTLTNPFNPSGVNGAGYDPMTAMLEALGNSPDAAKQFFTDPPTAYNEDGTVNKGATADLGKADDTPIDNYLDFFGTEKWEGYPDTNEHNPAGTPKNHMPDALGRALEAATLGYPAGHPDGDVVRDADNAAIMRQVMEKYGSDVDLLDHQKALSDSLGNMGAGYVNDINWALEKNSPDSVFAGSEDGRISFADTDEGNGRSTVRGFLSALGQHPDAYATVSTAEQVYTRSVLEAQVGPDGINRDGAREAVRVGSEVQGMLDQSRADQVEATNLKTHEEYEKAVEKRAGLIGIATGVGVGAAVAFLPAAPVIGAAAVLIPLASEVGPALVEGTVGQIVGGVSENSIDQHKEKVEDLVGEEKTKIYSSGEILAEAPMEGFLAQHGRDGLREDLVQSQSVGYGEGNARAKQQGHAPKS